MKIAGNARIVGVHRNGEVIVPRGDTVLQQRDTLVLIGDADSLREARGQLDPTSV